jgi:hypothetical protein
MPFIMTEQLHMPPANMVQRFWTMLQAILSSQTQVTFMPPWHFSTLKPQRGTIIQLVATGMPPVTPTPGAPIEGFDMPGIPIPVRSIIIALDIRQTPFLGPADSASLILLVHREVSRRALLRPIPGGWEL